jgi:hypothetical protein
VYAFEVSSSEPPDQEQLMIRLARVHPAASSSKLCETAELAGQLSARAFARE